MNPPVSNLRKIFIDPSYSVFNDDKLFDLSNQTLNRDGQLLPFHRMREHFRAQGIDVHTADGLGKHRGDADGQADYYSLGILDNFDRISSGGTARLAAFVIMEPPVVIPQLYAALPQLTAAFDRVYLHNTAGDGYSLTGVDTAKLHRLYWPLPHDHVLEPFWSNETRMRRVVVINGSHKPRSRDREQYSLRIIAMAQLAKRGVVDLYGIGWNRWWSRSALWLPYWLNLRALMSIYKGKCASKFAVLQRYEFCLCFENMRMEGYITEKIFDCLYAGTIPLYLGAPDILDYIPSNVFIDCRKYSSWSEMWNDVSTLSPGEIKTMREAGRTFLASEMAQKFCRSIENICTV
jgi:hypothetical protein